LARAGAAKLPAASKRPKEQDLSLVFQAVIPSTWAGNATINLKNKAWLKN